MLDAPPTPDPAFQALPFLGQSAPPPPAWLVTVGLFGSIVAAAVFFFVLLRFKERASQVASLAIVCGILATALAYFFIIGNSLLVAWDAPLSQALRQNAFLSLGIPLAALGALALVVLLPTVTQSALKAKAFGIELEGPTVGIILWLLCFGAIVGAIKWLASA